MPLEQDQGYRRNKEEVNMKDIVYLCLDCGRVSSTRIEVCPICKGRNITEFKLSGVYGGGG